MVVHGCGRFPDEAWVEVVAAKSDEVGRDFLIHMERCPLCRAEYVELARFGRRVRQALDGSTETKRAFVDAVMAAVTAERWMSPLQSGGHRRADRRRRPSFQTRLRSRPVTLAAACALTLLLIFVSGVLPWPIGRETTTGSTGYTVPGGTILTLDERRRDLLADALTTQGAVAAGTHAEAIVLMAKSKAERPASARPIHTSRGVAVAVAEVNGF